MRVNLITLLAVFALTASFIDAGSLLADTPRYPLKSGVLFVPRETAIESGDVDLIVHLHGAPEVVRENIAKARPGTPSVILTLPGLSSVYRKHFQDPEVFPAMLSEIRQRLAEALEVEGIGIRHLTVTSFSAGFGGLRELLKQPESAKKIDAIVLADSLYAGFEGDPAERRPNKAHMAPFLSFARKAAEGRCWMVVTYSHVPTPDYASTEETAHSLIRELGGASDKQRRERPGGLVELSRFEIGHFTALEFEGATGEDHLKHLRNLHLFLDELVNPNTPTGR